jgi:hypothetical protein
LVCSNALQTIANKQIFLNTLGNENMAAILLLKDFFIVMNAKVILLDLSTNLFEKTQKRAFVLRGI